MRDAWWLDSAEERAAEAPRKFFIPPREERETLEPGRLVKLIFCFEDRIVDGQLGTAERMWVEVEGRNPAGGYIGRLENEPRFLDELKLGDPISFGPEHVCQKLYSDEEIGYSVDEWAFIDRELLKADVAPPIAYRSPATTERPEIWGLGLRDRMPDTPIVLGDLTDRWPALEDAFRAGEGTWELQENGEYVRITPEPGVGVPPPA